MAVAVLRVRVADTATITARSGGEVLKGAWLDDDFNPVPSGLLDESIFGPYRPLRCACPTPPPTNLRLGQPCPRCHTDTEVNEQPWGPPGHIALPEPVLHPLCHRVMARLLGRPPEQVTALATGGSVLVVDPAETGAPPGGVLTVEQLRTAEGDGFVAYLETEQALRKLLSQARDAPDRWSVSQRRAFAAFDRSGVDPGDLLMGAVPVLPSAARGGVGPCGPLDGRTTVLLNLTERYRFNESIGMWQIRPVHSPDGRAQPNVFRTMMLLYRQKIARAVYRQFLAGGAWLLRRPPTPRELPLVGYLSRFAGRPVGFTLDGGVQDIEADDTPRTRALLEALALTVVEARELP